MEDGGRTTEDGGQRAEDERTATDEWYISASPRLRVSASGKSVFDSKPCGGGA